MKKYIVALSFLAVLAIGTAQTRLTFRQVRATATGILLGMSDGTFATVKIGSGLQVVTPAGAAQPELQAVVTVIKPLMPVTEADITANTDGTLSIAEPQCCVAVNSIHLYRNGVRQKRGVDYTAVATASGATITPIGPWDVGSDVMLADYQRQ